MTGAGSGIGRLISLMLSRLRCIVALWDVNKAGITAVKDEILANGGVAEMYVVDVTDVDAVNDAAQKVCDSFGQIDMLVSSP